jgi:hypothetical protein
MSIDSVKRKLDSMLSEIDEDDERELEDAIQVWASVLSVIFHPESIA